MKQSRELAVLDEALQLLEKTTSIEDITAIRHKAEAARSYAKAAKLSLDIHNRAAEVKIRAERKAGAFLAMLKLRGGDRRSKRQRAPLKLEDLGITRDQSKRWQRLAAIPEEQLRRYVTAANHLGQEITAASLLRTARMSNPHGRRTVKSKPHFTIRNRGGQEAWDPADREIIGELSSHFRLLSGILFPICEDEQARLKRSERRMVGRVLGEVGELLRRLNISLCLVLNCLQHLIVACTADSLL